IVGPQSRFGIACRVYAPVGTHEELLAYLVRRLLENGANTSFVNRFSDAERPAAEVVADPLAILPQLESIPHPRLPLPRDLYLPERLNSRAYDQTDSQVVEPLIARLDDEAKRGWRAGPIVAGRRLARQEQPLTDPSDRRRVVGLAAEAEPADLDAALDHAARAAYDWDRAGAPSRAQLLERMAELLEQHYDSLMALAVREAGKTVDDALAEVREAVDCCRYYAARARRDLSGQAPPLGRA